MLTVWRSQFGEQLQLEREAHIAVDLELASEEQLLSAVGVIEQLNEVDTDGVAPMTSVTEMLAPMRVDEVTDGDCRDEVLANAPEETDGFYVVPKVVE